MSKKLIEKGWETIEIEVNDDNSLLEIAKKYGYPFPDSNGNLIQNLHSKQIGTGIKSSFSYNYGFSEFPFHTDTAFDNIPARYFILTSIFSSETCTNIIDFNSIRNALDNNELNTLTKSIFLLKTPQEQKFSSIFFLHNGFEGFRFDPNIMIPYNLNAKKAVEIIKNNIDILEPIKIKWDSKKILVVDNWRCIHSRDNVKDTNRTLKRIYIK